MRLPGGKKINLGNKAAMGAADKEEKEEVELRRDGKRGEGGNKRDGFVRRGGGQKKEVFALLSVVKAFSTM